MSIFAGVEFTRTVALSDPGQDGLTATVDYGDGSPVEAVALGSARALTLAHRYATPGSYTITVAVRDDADAASGRVVVTVGDPAPRLTAGANAPTVPAGSAYTFDLGSVADDDASGPAMADDGDLFRGSLRVGRRRRSVLYSRTLGLHFLKEPPMNDADNDPPSATPESA